MSTGIARPLTGPDLRLTRWSESLPLLLERNTDEIADNMQDDCERAKMLRGELYLASDPELVSMRASARRLTALLKEDDLRSREIEMRLLGRIGVGSKVECVLPLSERIPLGATH